MARTATPPTEAVTRFSTKTLLFLLTAPALFAQPVISSGGIVNAAGYQPASSAGGGIAQGSIFSIFGSSLGPAAPGVQAPRFPLESTLAGVSVRLAHQSGLTIDAVPLFASSTQINALLPSATPVGLALLTVVRDGRTSNAELIKVVRSSFGAFTVNSSGTGPAIVQNFVSAGEQTLNLSQNPARPGQTVILWGTGLGPVAVPDHVSPARGNLNEAVEVTVGGRPVTLDYRGRSGCCAGVDQLNFRIPADAPGGCAVPVSVKVQNGVYSNIASIAIDTERGGCSPAIGERRWGQVSLVRTVTEGGGSSDSASAVFGDAEPLANLPPSGQCGSTTASAGLLDAGRELTLNGPQGARTIPREATGAYRLGSGLFLGPGSYTAMGPGGSDVGPFQGALEAAPSLAWTTTAGDRTRGLTIGWTGGDLAVISGDTFTCVAPAASGALTVSPAALANLPAQATIRVGSLSQSRFTAPGLAYGLLTYTQFTARSIPLGPAPLPSSPVRLPDGQAILAELAATDPERQRGLMQRAELAPDRGMLFLYGSQQSLSFWMYRTLIPLDIIWLDANRRIVFISANTPPCGSEDSRNCPVYGGRELSQYVLEIGAGLAARHGLRVGDRLDW